MINKTDIPDNIANKALTINNALTKTVVVDFHGIEYTFLIDLDDYNEYSKLFEGHTPEYDIALALYKKDSIQLSRQETLEEYLSYQISLRVQELKCNLPKTSLFWNL